MSPIKNNTNCAEEGKECTTKEEPRTAITRVKEIDPKDVNDGFSPPTEVEQSPVEELNEESPVTPQEMNDEVAPLKQQETDDCAPPKVIIRRVVATSSTLTKKRFPNRNKKKAEETPIVLPVAKAKAEKVEKSLPEKKGGGELFLDQLDLSLVHPSELEVTNLKQLNDAIERGKIRVYPEGTPRTPITPKRTMDKVTGGHGLLRRVLVFNDENIPPPMEQATEQQPNTLKPKKDDQNEMDISGVGFLSITANSPPRNKPLRERNVVTISPICSLSHTLKNNGNAVSMLLETR